jgi:hypothetical protein
MVELILRPGPHIRKRLRESSQKADAASAKHKYSRSGPRQYFEGSGVAHTGILPLSMAVVESGGLQGYLFVGRLS